MNKLSLFLGIFLCLLFKTGHSQTNVSGVISTNTTWTKAGSPYNITGNTQINSGSVLTIEPGARIVFTGNFYLKALGNIIAIGNSVDSIYFETNSTNAKIGNGIHIRNSATALFDLNNNYLSGSIFKFASFKNFSKAIYFYQAGVAIQNCTFLNNDISFEPRSNLKSLIENSVFKNNNYGLYVISGYSWQYDDEVNCIQDVIVQNNEFINTEIPIYIGLNQRTVKNFKITGNRFISSSNTAISFDAGGTGYFGTYIGEGVDISNNIFKDNNNALIVSIYGLGDNGCSNVTSGSCNTCFITIKRNIFINNKVAVNLKGANSSIVSNNIITNNDKPLILGKNGVGNGRDNTIKLNQFINSNNSIFIIPDETYYQSGSTENNSIILNTFQQRVNKNKIPLFSVSIKNSNNSIQQNNFTIYDTVLLKLNANGSLTFSNNYTLVSRILANDIYDQNDNIDLGLVQITSPSLTPIINAPISMPNNLVKSVSAGRVVLTWIANAESDIAGYKVYYGGFTGYSYSTVIDVGNVTSYTLPAGVSINEDIAVTAYDSDKDGIDDQFDGNESWYSTANVAPSIPTNLSIDSGSHRIKINWEKVNGATNYNIYRSVDANTYTKVGSSTITSYLDDSLDVGKRYYYKITAFDSIDLSYTNYGLESGFSDIQAATPTNIIFVDANSGNDSNIGSNLSPVLKISRAASIAYSGDTIFIKDGTYTDNISYSNKQLNFIGINGASKVIVKPLLNSHVFYMDNGGNSLLKGITFANGSDRVAGSAFLERLSSPTIESCIFKENKAAGGVVSTQSGTITINNSIAYGNTPNTFFELSNSVSSPATINHFTYVGNTGLLFSSGNSNYIANFKNSILWGNSNIAYTGIISVENSIIKGGFPGTTSNIDDSPRFLDSSKNDFRLANFSPAIGLGKPLVGVITDFSNLSRPNPSVSNPDAGAYESSFDHPSPIIVKDSSNLGFVKLEWKQFPLSTVDKVIIYKGLDSSRLLRYDTVDVNSVYIDIDNSDFNKILYYSTTSVGQGLQESGIGNVVKTISFTPPTLSSINIDNIDTSAVLTWTRIPNSLKYNLQVSNDSNFKNTNTLSVADTSYLFNGLMANSTYYWRVQTVDTIHTSKWSSVNIFKTKLKEPIISKISAGNKVDTLQWSANKNINVYKYYIYRGLTDNPTTILDSVSGSTLIYIDTTNLTLNSKYFYRVAVVDSIGIIGPLSKSVSAIPFNQNPISVKLINKAFNNVGEFNFVRTNYSANGSKDVDGKITDFKWYVNDSLVNTTDSILIYYFNQGSNKVKLVVTDNDGGKDSSSAIVTLSSFVKTFSGGFLGGITALGPNIIYTADTTYNPINGASVSKLDRSGNTVYPLVVSSKIFTTPSVSSDSSVFITSGSSLNGFNKSGAPLWSTIPLGGLSYVTPTIDSLFNRIYVGVSNKNFFAIDYKTGKVVWNLIGDAPINASAIITGDRKLVFTSEVGTLYGFDIRTNVVQTAAKWTTNFGEVVSKSPAVDANNNLIISTEKGNVIKVRLNDDGSVARIWSVNINASIHSSPVIDADGFIYLGNSIGDFYKLNPDNGAVIWKYATGGAIKSTPAISEFGNIYISNSNGLVTALTTNKLLKWTYQADGPISANMLYISNMLYVGTEKGILFAVYDNPATKTVNTSLSINIDKNRLKLFSNGSLAARGSLNFNEHYGYYFDVYKNHNIDLTLEDNVIAKEPIWGTFQGNYRRTGSKSFECPEVPVIQVPNCVSPADSIKISTTNMSNKYWVVNDVRLTNITDNSIYVKTTDKYKLVAFNSIGCEVYSTTPVFISNSNITKPSVITSNGTGKICDGDSLILSSSIDAVKYQWFYSGSPITNKQSKSLKTSLAGSYSLSVVNEYGCSSTSDLQLVMVNKMPNAPIVNSITYCQGSNATQLSANSSNTDTLVWYSVPMGGIGTRVAPTPNTSVIGTTSYYVSQINSSGCESARSKIDVVVTAPPARPTISTSGSTSFCTGGSVTLQSSANTGNQWFKNGQIIPNATSSSYTAVSSGKYSLSVTYTSGCTVFSDEIQVLSDVSNSTAIPVINGINTDSTICFRDSLLLRSTNQYDRYLWSNGDTTSSTIVKNSDNVTLRAAFNGSSCFSLPSSIISGKKNLNISPVISQQGTNLIATNSNNFKWFRNNTIVPGVTAATLNNPAVGVYRVETSLDNYCWDVSPDYMVITNSSLMSDTVRISVYPNPSSGVFNVVADFQRITNVITKLTVVDVNGKVVYQSQRLVFFSNKIILPVSLANAKGLYGVNMDINGTVKSVIVVVD